MASPLSSENSLTLPQSIATSLIKLFYNNNLSEANIMKIQHKCDNYSNLCDNNVTYKPNCLSKSIQLRTASLLHKHAWSIHLCVEWHRVTLLNLNLWSLPGQFYGDIAIFEEGDIQLFVELSRLFKELGNVRANGSWKILFCPSWLVQMLQ